MGRCVIFCAGEFNGLLCPIDQQDHVIAADGGFQHTQALGLTPHDILGDFDSLGYVPQGSSVFPVEKDDTDAMLAVRRGLALGFREFHLYGCLDGPRLDHTLANFQTLLYLAEHDASGYLIGKDYIATVLRNGRLEFPPEAEGILSLFCLGPDAHGVSLSGLKYCLTNGTLTAGFPLGVSNHFTGQAASVCVADGSLLVLYSRKNGLPKQEVRL